MTKLRQWIPLTILASLWACGAPEQAAVDQFFRAAQTNDSATLAYMSAVGSPLEVESWKVVEVSSRTREPFTLSELLERFAAAEKARNASQEKRQTYAEENKEALEQVIPKLREDPEYEFRGKLGAIQEEWMKLLDERKETESAFQELKQVVNRESSLAGKSVMRQVDLGKCRGEIAVTEMLLNLKPKEGGELPFKVTLRKYELKEPETDRIEPARWVIVGIEGATEEARAAAVSATAKTRGPVSAPAAAAESTEASPDEGASASEPSARRPARELRGQARVQILAPKTAVEGDEVVSTVRVRNASDDWIVGFMVTEFWYDQQGNAVSSSSSTHRRRFMPGDVVELKLRTRKGANFFQNQFEFSHSNGDVKATVVDSFPGQT